MIKDYFLLAFRGIVKRGLRSWLTMIGIVIGIAAVVSLISLGNGMQNAITSQFSGLGSDKLTVSAKGGLGVPGLGVLKPLTTDDVKAIKGVNGVSDAIGRILEPVKVEINNKIDFRVIASAPDDLKLFDILMENLGVKIIEGRMLKTSDKAGVMVTYDYYKDNNFFDRKLSAGDTIKINDKKFTVVGLIGKTGNPLMDQAIVMMESALRDFINEKERVDVILVVVSKGSDINSVAAKIEDLMRRRRDVKEGKEDFNVQTPQELLNSINSVLNVVNVILIGIASISLIVGGIGIMNTMYTSVLERRREIGIMKSIGAKNSAILSLYLIESGLLGLVGGTVGVLLGMGFSKLVEIIAQSAGISLLKASFSLYLIVGSLLFSFIVGIISGTLPALQASKLKPVDALKGSGL